MEDTKTDEKKKSGARTNQQPSDAGTPPPAASGGANADQQPSNAGTPPPAGSAAEPTNDQRLAAQKEELTLQEALRKEQEIGGLKAENGELTKKLAEAEGAKAALVLRAEAAERERDAFRAKLQQEKVGTLALEQGQAQLLESVTVVARGGMRVDAKLGDVLVRNGSKAQVDAAQAKFGKNARVYAVDAAEFDALVNGNLAVARE